MEKPKITKEIIISVIDKLIGPIEPVADTAIDNKRFENCQLYLDVLEEMYTKVNDLSEYHKNSKFSSVKRIQLLCEEKIEKLNAHD